jgi:hypothetical protein
MTPVSWARPGQMEGLVRKGIETELHLNNMNREEGFSLSRSWTPLIQALKERRKDISHYSFLIRPFSKTVVFNLFSPRTPRDTFPLNFVPPKLLVHNSVIHNYI